LTSQSLLIFANNWDILLSTMIVKGQPVKLSETVVTTTTLDLNRHFQRLAEKCDRQTRKTFNDEILSSAQHSHLDLNRTQGKSVTTSSSLSV